MPRGVAMASAGAFDGKVFLIGGDDDFFPGSGVSDEVNVYDIATNSWSSGTPLPVATSRRRRRRRWASSSTWSAAGVSRRPISNVNATQRYDMTTDTWETGPEFATPRRTSRWRRPSEALYAIGGDSDGAGFFDASSSVYRARSGRLAGRDMGGSRRPAAGSLRSANQAGFCTNAISGGEIWSVGGLGSPTSPGTTTTSTGRPARPAAAPPTSRG